MAWSLSAGLPQGVEVHLDTQSTHGAHFRVGPLQGLKVPDSPYWRGRHSKAVGALRVRLWLPDHEPARRHVEPLSEDAVESVLLLLLLLLLLVLVVLVVLVMVVNALTVHVAIVGRLAHAAVASAREAGHLRGSAEGSRAGVAQGAHDNVRHGEVGRETIREMLDARGQQRRGADVGRVEIGRGRGAAAGAGLGLEVVNAGDAELGLKLVDRHARGLGNAGVAEAVEQVDVADGRLGGVHQHGVDELRQHLVHLATAAA